ncbi:hypothetical protein GCM10023162_40180 [Klenkia terrae]
MRCAFYLSEVNNPLWSIMVPVEPVRRDLLPLAVATPWAVCAALRVTGYERGWPLVPAMSFVPYAAASSVLPLALAVARRSPAATLLVPGDEVHPGSHPR